MESEARRRQRIATAVALVTALCILCALLIAMAQDGGRIAFNAAQLVMRMEGGAAWS